VANNYRHFSFALKLANKKEAVWFQKRLEKAAKTPEEDEWGSMADFDWIVYPVNAEDKNLPHVWFRDNGEYGNVEQVANYVQEYLKKFCHKGYFTMSWADTCSKHRLGEFGGGFVVVTAKEQHWMNESAWVTKHTKGLESRNEG